MTELDRATIVVGLPKNGKTTIARKESKAFLEEYPAGLVLAHDMHEQLAPDITRVYSSIEEWRQFRAANKTAPRGASFRCSGAEVVNLAIELGERHNRAKDVRVPIRVVIEEGSLAPDLVTPTHMSELAFKLFANRRHYGIWPYINIQTQRAATSAFFEQVTDAFIFAQTERNARALEEKLSLPEGALDKTIMEPPLRVCPKHHYHHWRQGEGLVNE